MFELVVVIAVGALAGCAASFARGFIGGLRKGWLDQRRAERVLVHTTDGQTLEGTLTVVGADGIVLTAVVLVDHGVDVAGDVWVPKAKVLMVQRPPVVN